MQSTACCGHNSCDSSERLGCNLCGQTKGAEAAIQPEWLVDIKVKSRVRSREVLQKMAVVKKLSVVENLPPSPPSCGPLGIIALTADCEWAKTTFLSDLNSLKQNSLKRKVPQMCRPASSKPPFPNTLQWSLVETDEAPQTQQHS